MKLTTRKDFFEKNCKWFELDFEDGIVATMNKGFLPGYEMVHFCKYDGEGNSINLGDYTMRTGVYKESDKNPSTPTERRSIKAFCDFIKAALDYHDEGNKVLNKN